MTLYTHLRIEEYILEVNNNTYSIDMGELWELHDAWWMNNKSYYTEVTDNPKTIVKIMRLQGIC